MSWDSINNHIVHQEDKDIVWILKQITAREEPLIETQPYYKGAWLNGVV